jgi:hypothetical protein
MVYGGANPSFGGVTFPIAIGTFFQLNCGEATKRMVYGGANPSFGGVTFPITIDVLSTKLW